MSKIWRTALSCAELGSSLLLRSLIWRLMVSACAAAVPTLKVADVKVTEGNGGVQSAVFTVKLSGASTEVVTVNYSTADGTAEAGVDYEEASGTLVFNPGATQKTVSVAVVGDTLDENNETFFLDLSDAENAAIADAQSKAMINDDDAAPGLSVSDVSVDEGDEGTTEAVFEITLSSPSTKTVSAAYVAMKGKAAVGSDFEPASGTVVFNPGETVMEVVVLVNGETVYEPDESFTLKLSKAVNGQLADAIGVCTIVNDDSAPAISVGDVSVTEGDAGGVTASFAVQLTAPSSYACKVKYSTAEGTATANKDFKMTSGLLSFKPGETVKPVRVTVHSDLLNEPDENFFLNLSLPVNATLDDDQGECVILNNDPEPALRIKDVFFRENVGSLGYYNFQVSLSAPSGRPVYVDYETVEETATPGEDFQLQTGTLMIPPGNAFADITIFMQDDDVDEVDETFIVRLSNPQGAVLEDEEAIGMIVDDDPGYGLAVGLGVSQRIVEGNIGTNQLVNVILTQPRFGAVVTVDYFTSDGTATAGSDYVATSGTLVFSPGSVLRTISVPILPNTTWEPEENLFLNLVNPANATILLEQHEIIIEDDDPGPTFSISDVSVLEGDTTTNAVFTVTLSEPVGVAASVHYATANGTALAGADYLATSGTLIFPANTTSQVISVPVVGDNGVESNETFFVNLTLPMVAAIADSQGVGTILEDEGLPGLSVGDVAVLEASGGSTNAVFAVTLSTPSAQVITVEWTTANGTALGGSDYAAGSGQITFPPGTTNQTVVVFVHGDLVDEPEEMFVLNLTNPVNATVVDGQGVGTIQDNDPPVALFVNNPTVLEGNAGTSNATFTVSLSAPSGFTVSADFSTASGTALGDTDYVSTVGVVTFPPGTTNQSVAVAVIGDVMDEPNEGFLLNLSNPANATIGGGQGTGTIIDDDAAPAISIDGVNTVNEGDAGSVNAVFSVHLSNPSSQAVTVDWATADDLAAAGQDYTTASGTLSFAPGTTNATLTVVVLGDTFDEVNETFLVNLSNPANATIADGLGVGGIADDDPAPDLAVNDLTVVEGDAGSVATNFVLTISNPSGKVVSVAWSTANGSASAGADYTGASGVVTFSPGTTSQAVSMTVAGDLLDEPDETFALNLSNAVNANLPDPQAVGTIIDDDPAPAISIGNVTVDEGHSGTVNAVFPLALSAPSGQAVSVSWVTADGTALAGSDFTAGSSTITFAPGVTNQTVSIAVQGDITDEPGETFSVNLSSPLNATLGNNQGIGTILDDDNAPSISVGPRAVTEPDSGSTNLVLSVVLSAPSAQVVTVNWSTANATAVAPSDYTASSGIVTFPPGTTNQPVAVPVNGDLLDELDETFLVNLSNPSNATIGGGQAVVTIMDNDPTPTLSVSDQTVAEGDSGPVNMTFTIQLSAASAQTVSVAWMTAGGTATAGADFVTASGTAVFAPGNTSQLVIIQVNGDTLDEGNETLSLNLTNPVNAEVADSQGLGTITDDDPAPALSISDVLIAEGNSGTTNALVTLTLSAASGQTVTVDWAAANGSAVAGADYQAGSGTASFAPGTTSVTVGLVVQADLLDEPDETFVINLTNPVNVGLPDAQGLVTITDDDPEPVLTINDVTVTEGNAGTVTAAFSVFLSAPSGRTVVVNYSTATNTASAPSDFIAGAGTLSFNPGTTNQTVNVGVVGDTLDEVDETFFVELTSPLNAGIADGQGVGTISDDDAAPSLTINNVTVTEGTGGTTNAVFTVSLSAPSGQMVAVDWSTSNGTALAPGDYAAASGSVTFAPGETTQTIVIVVNNDALDEPSESFFVNLANPTAATIADNQGVGTIVDDDPAPSVVVGDIGVVESDSGTVAAVFTVTLSAASGQSVSVNWATANGTAVAGADYVAGAGVLNFSPGTTSLTLSVAVNGDLLDEPNETVLVNLSGASNATIGDGQGVGTITDNDPTPALSINDVTVSEGNTGTVQAVFTVTLSAASGQTVSVNWATADGVAAAPGDYEAASGSLTFNPGTTTQTLAVVVNADALDEPNETFAVNLSGAANAGIADGQGTGVITDDDAAPSLVINNVTVTEGNSGTVNATFTVTLSAASGQTIAVDWATADGTALAPGDYTAALGTLTIPAGTTMQSMSVAVNSDTWDEPAETFVVNLMNPVNVTITDSQGVGTITDDDPMPSLSVGDTAVGEGDSGSVTAVFTISLSGPSGQTVSVNWATSNGSAVAGSDYLSASGNVLFLPGSTNATVSVTVFGDAWDEANEVFYIDLNTGSNATIADGQGAGTITDDDPTPGLAISDVSVLEGDTGSVTAVFNVTLSAVSGQTVTVDWATANGSAVAPGDYAAGLGSLTFLPGSTAQTISLPVYGDTVDESAELFVVNLSNAINAVLTDAQGQGIITDDDGPPTISVNDVTVAEGDSGTLSAVFTLSLSRTSSQVITVDWASADGTALAGSDYAAASGSISFPAGSTNQLVTIQVLGDLLDELAETFFVNLSRVVNATIADAQGIGTIADNDPSPALSINDVSVTEGNSGSVTVQFTVRLSAPSTLTVTANYATASGTAVSPDDFTAGSGSLTFAPGVTNQTIAVIVASDSLDEPTETFFVNLSGTTNATVADGQGAGTVLDDDPAPLLSINDISVAEGDSGFTTATFTVALSAPSSFQITVNCVTADGTASAASDYSSAASTLTFAPGVTNQTFTVSVGGDTLDEADETFFVNLNGAVNATIADGQGLGTILDNDPTPSLVIIDVPVTEGNSGSVNAVFAVSLSAASGKTVTVDWATANGTASSPADYVANSGTVTFAPGTTTQNITIQVNGDGLAEPNETFYVNLSNASNATIADAQGLGTIQNDDPDPNISINNVTVAEGDSGVVSVVFTVTLSAASGQTVMVNYATADGSAVAGADYTSTSGTLTFVAGDTSQTVTVLVSGETVYESNETFLVNLSNAVNAAFLDSQGVGTITNDDPVPSLKVGDIAVAEGNSGTSAAAFSVTLSNSSSQTITVGYATANGTASSANDYVSTSGTLTFLPGATTQIVAVTIDGDSSKEANETFFLNLSAASNATIADAQGVCTILNDDGPLLTISNVMVIEGNGGTVNVVFTVTLSPITNKTVRVNYATANGTATAGSDYVAASGTLTFSSGQTTKTITITVNGDTTFESNETFFVNLSNPNNATIFDDQGMATIQNDDAGPPGSSYEEKPVVTSIRRLEDGRVRLRATGPGQHFGIIEATVDFAHWEPLASVEFQEREIEWTDDEASLVPIRFYRVRLAGE